MPYNGSGTYVRTENWTNDANNNLPINAGKFDNEANDMAGAFGLCLTRDGQGVPTQALTWSYSLTVNVAADGAVFTAGRTGGSNNPQVQVKVADGSGGILNLTTSQSLALAIAGTNIFSVSASAITGTQPLTANSFIPSSATVPSNGMYLPAANQVGFAINGANAATLSSSGLSVSALTASGAITAASCNLTSDGRLKEDVQPVVDALSKVRALRGVTFRFKKKENRSLGFIAQQVREVVPEVVVQGEGGYLSVAYGNLVGLLVEAVKELAREVEELRGR